MDSELRSLIEKCWSIDFVDAKYSTVTSRGRFYLQDPRDEEESWFLAQENANAVAHFSNKIENLEIINIEQCVKDAPFSTEQIESSCDFMLHDGVEKSILIFNELTASEVQYVLLPTKGKLDKAKKQIQNVIKLLSKDDEVQNLINSYEKKIALFSWRRTEIENLDSVSKSITAFTSVQKINPKRMQEKLDNGFIFSVSIYPDKFRIDRSIKL